MFNKYANDWFGVTSADFKTTHFPSNGYEWVEAKSTSSNYYVRNGMYITAYSPRMIAEQVVKQGSTFVIKCSDSSVMRNVIDALGDPNEIKLIMRTLGIARIERVSYVENANSNCLRITIQSPDLPSVPIEAANHIVDPCVIKTDKT